MNRAKILLVDPPTQYNDLKAVRRDNPNQATKFGLGAAGRYVDSMSAQQLAVLKPIISGLVHPDAYVFMWSTGVHLPEAFAILDYWGMEYKTMAFVWVKTNKCNGESFQGPGSYTWQNAEYCLLARPIGAGGLWHSNTAGCQKPCQIIEAREEVAIRSPHPRGEDGKIIHSRKPEIFHRLIEEWLWPHMDREQFDSVELFATQKRDGWECIGHSVSGNLIGADVPYYPRRLARKMHGVELLAQRAVMRCG